MKDLLEYIVKNLVGKKEAVTIDETSSGGEVQLILTVDPEDMGIVIGKNGQTIKAIRRLLGVRAMAESVRVNLQLNDVGEQVTQKSSENHLNNEKDEDAEPPKQGESDK